MSDADHYLKATLEIDDKLQDPALWAKAMALCEGNIKKSKYLYIKLRVEMLLADEKLVKVDQSNIPDQNLETKRNDELVEVSQAEAIEQDFEGALESKPKPFEYGGRVFPDSFTRQKALTMSNVKKKALEDKKEALNKALLESYITVEAYSEKTGNKVAQVISKLEAGYLDGKLVNGGWLVAPDHTSMPRNETITSSIEINRPLNWCYFWNYILLPLNVFVDLIIVIGGQQIFVLQQIFALSPGIILALLLHGSIAVALVIGLHERRQWAWTLNGYFLVFSSLLQVIFMSENKDVGFIILWVIMHATIWLWPNEVYWTKRKHLFNT